VRVAVVVHRVDLVATDSASPQRVPISFRVGERCGNE
jgi:hypothetical protein